MTKTEKGGREEKLVGWAAKIWFLSSLQGIKIWVPKLMKIINLALF